MKSEVWKISTTTEVNMYKFNLIRFSVFIFSLCYCFSIALGQKRANLKLRIVVFDFNTENIPATETSFFENAKVNFPRSIANGLKEKSNEIDVLERDLLPDVHREVKYAKDNPILFDATTVVKIETKGGNAGLVGVLVYESSGKIKLITKLVNIKTSSLITSDERKVKLDEFWKNSEKFADEIAKKIVIELINNRPEPPTKRPPTSVKKSNKTWLWIGGVGIAVGGTLAAVLQSGDDSPSSQELPGPNDLWPPRDK